MKKTLSVVAALLLFVLQISPLCAAEEQLINGFESEAELADWQISSAGTKLVTEGVTEGNTALECTFDPQGEWAGVTTYWQKVVGDWSGYDALVIDVLNPNPNPIDCYVLVGDAAWEAKRTYWNRHNGTITFAPGKNQWVIPTQGLFRGEAGSRNADIKENIDPSKITRLDLNFGAAGQSGRVIIDNIRLVKMDRQEGVWAYDFGPESQQVMMGWTAVSNKSAYNPLQGFGWVSGGPWEGAARDTTFGSVLTRDFCEATGYNFRVDVPPGLYDVLVVFENSGYWGGEQTAYRSRGILVDGIPVYAEQRADGATGALYRFEDIEPVGVDLWDTYMESEVTRPVRFQAVANAEGITFNFRSDVTWGAKISALALCNAEDAASVQWISDQWAAVKAEFSAKAVCLDTPAPEVRATGDWAQKGFIAWPVKIEDEIKPESVPISQPELQNINLTCEVVKGEYEPLCLAVRPQRDLGECSLNLAAEEDFPAMKIQTVWYNTSRGFSNISYRIRPHTLRDAETVNLKKDISRMIVLTAYIDANTKPGVHIADLILTAPDGQELFRVPVKITVHDITLSRDTGYLLAMFGLDPPSNLLTPVQQTQALSDTLEILQQHGMNALCGGPSFTLTGWQGDQPVIDFGQCDEFFEMCRANGFTKAINGYGGLRFNNLHDGYQIGSAKERVEQESGLDYETAFLRAWEAVDTHARANNWPLIYYAMCDETRVRETAEAEIELMKLMAKASARFPQTLRSSGAYSVDFKTRPTDENDMLYWHQRFFETLDVSSLNLHDQSVLDEAKALGKEVHVYNQGTSRYTFGLYQWSEYQKGVKALWQWHLNILHGYQFFDLDGREPDTAMICYGRKGIYPTIDFERCREGAEDFYLFQTLTDQIAKNRAEGKKVAETDNAETMLKGLIANIAVCQQNAPEDFDAIKNKQQVIGALLEIK